MACVYELDGHTFNSELELDDFLIEKYPLKSVLGDLVYSESTHTARTHAKLEQIKQEADKITAWENRIRVWDEDGKTYRYKNPYIGVNAFLSQYRDEEGHPLFPIFQEENYWAIRRGQWSKGDFTEDEREVFFGEETPKPITENYDYYRNLMEEKWEAQCLHGDAIHAVFEQFFDPDAKIGYNHLQNKTFARKDGSKVKFEQLMSPDQYEKTLGKAQELKQELIRKFSKNKNGPGDDLLFYPEFKISGKLNQSASTEVNTLLGYIDLLVIDKEGNLHIIDYKTSPKSIENYNKVKQYTYQYQLATYGRMIAQAGFNTDRTKYLVVPIQLADFKKNEEGQYVYSGLNLADGIFQDISNEIRTRTVINNNLDDIIKVEYKNDISTENLLQSVVKAMQEWFPRYKVFKTITEKEVIDELKQDDAFKKNPDTNRYEWTPKGTHNYIIWANSEEELIAKVLKHKEQLTRRRRDITVGVREALVEAIKRQSTDGITFAKLSQNFTGLNKDWLRLQMKKYANQNWKVETDSSYDGLLEFGIIVLRNENGQRDIIKCSTNNLKYTQNLSLNGKTHNLAGLFHNDLYYASNKSSYMLESARGNIELMEAMLVLNKCYDIFGTNGYVGNIEVINPTYGTGVSATNKELLYCFNELYRNKEIDEINHFKNGDIGMGTIAQNAQTLLNDILVQGHENDWSGRWSKFKNFNSCKSMLDAAIDTSYEEQIKALQNLAKKLQDTFEGKLDQLHIDQESASSEEVQLYNTVLLALAQLRNVNFRQQLSDHKQWVETLAIFGEKGLQGTYQDNPGNLLSQNLNILTNLVTEAYQGVRSDIQKLTPQLRGYLEKLKQDQGFNVLKENTIGNQADLYSNMFRTTADGDWLVKNPWTDSTLKDSEREFLKFFLEKVNDNRFANKGGNNSEYVQQLRDTDSVEYFRVPLTIGDNASRISAEGLLPALKYRLRGWIPSEALKRAKDKSTRFVNDLRRSENEEFKPAEEDADLFEFVNNFDKGESEFRMDMLSNKSDGTKGEYYYEHNLETLLLKHAFAYSMKEHVDSVFPTIKAALIHLTVMGNQQNTKFTNDLRYGAEYVKNKVKGESIVDPTYQKAQEISGKLRGLASKLVLGFSPVQFGYQMIQGIWNDIRLILQDKATGKNVFTLSHMLQAAKIVYSDLFRRPGEESVISKLNALYGINDMDINTYIDRIKSDQFGLMNFSNFLMKFASRPDYYNRMTIFVAKMLAEGSLDVNEELSAHTLNKNGELVYDVKKDRRFSRYLNNDKSDIKLYNEQKMLYLQMAKQFMDEGVIDRETWKESDGFPRAYTSQEAESMKALGDLIYGYYSSEKKSMIHATLLGGMFMQFRTYWSGKKNQYLQGGKVALEGHWEQYQENGKKYYYQVDEKGNILWNEPPTCTEETSAPMMIWKGDWREGIMQTITDIIWTKNWKEMWKEKWYNEDINLRNTYRSNIIQLGYDVVMFSTLGPMLGYAMDGWFNEEKKNASKQDIGDAVYLSALNIARYSLSHSFLDFNFIQSIGEPGVVWNPFAFSYLQEQGKNVVKFATGDKDIIDLIVGTNSAMKYTRPIWNTLKPAA